MQNSSKTKYDAAALIKAAFAILKTARQERGISICKAAWQIGVSVYFYKHIEDKPDAHCKMWLLFALCECYGLKTTDLFIE